MHIPQQSDIDEIVKSIESCVIHGLELPIQAQDLIKAYQTSTCFCDVYHYITDGKLPSGAKAQAASNCGGMPEAKDGFFTTYYAFNRIVLDVLTEKMYKLMKTP